MTDRHVDDILTDFRELSLPQRMREAAKVIADVLREHQWRKYEDRCRCNDPGTYDEHPLHVADLIAAAAEQHYRRRIETPEQLDALPVGAIVADLHCDMTPPPVYVRFIDGWSLDGLKVKPGRRNLTVLWSPGADK